MSEGGESEPSGEAVSRREPVPPVEPPPVEDEEQEAFGLCRSDRYFVLVMGSLILLLLSVQVWQRSWRGGETVEIHRLQSRQYEFQIEINRGTWVEWMQLEGIGEALGRRIVADREERGPFRSVEDVQRVRGIGPKTMERIASYLVCSDCEKSPQSGESIE